jgi:hypothetical protein
MNLQAVAQEFPGPPREAMVAADACVYGYAAGYEPYCNGTKPAANGATVDLRWRTANVGAR